MKPATTFVTDYQLKAQRAIQDLMAPLYERKLEQRIIYRNWDNTRQSEQQSTNSPRFF